MFKKIFYMTSLSLGVFSCGVKAPELESMDMGAPLKQPTYQTRSFENFEAGSAIKKKSSKVLLFSGMKTPLFQAFLKLSHFPMKQKTLKYSIVSQLEL